MSGFCFTPSTPATIVSMQIQTDVILAPFTMFQIGGAAHYFVAAKTDADVADALSFAREKNISHFVLGGGSNILVSDQGFPGLVIHMQNDEVFWNKDDTLVVAGAGASWDAVVSEVVAKHCYGLENLSGIPGSVGGAAGGNIGAYGSEVKETLEWVEVFDTTSLSVVRLSSALCRMGYRDTLFKQREGRHLVILRVAFRLSKQGVLDRGYKDIAEYEKHHGEIVSLSAMRAAVLDIRRKKFPADGSIGTAGSFFKNPVVSRAHAALFLKKFPDAPNFPQQGGTVKLSAAWIIDHVLHMRDVREKNVGTWESQALVLVNYGGARADEVMQFAQIIIDKAKNETDVVLAPEVIAIGA